MNFSTTNDGNDEGKCPIMKIPDQSDPTKLLKVLECPICLEVANPPVFTCVGHGHMICAECRKHHDMCPLCSTAISQNRCIFAEQCMEQIMLPCKYRDEGCMEVSRGTVYREHLLVCPYRCVECVMRRCPVKVPINRYFEHLKSDHSNSVNGIENTSKHTVEWWIDGSLQPARWPPYYFTCFNHVFLYMAISTMQGMWEWAWIIANEDEASRFRVSAKMHTVNNLADVQWTSFVHSIRKTVPKLSRYTSLTGGLCFVTNSKDIRNPFLFRKTTDAAAHLSPRYYWNTEVEFFQVKDPPKGSIPAFLTTDVNKDFITRSLPSGVSGKSSTSAVQGGPGPEEIAATADSNVDIDGLRISSPRVGSRSASETVVPESESESEQNTSQMSTENIVTLPAENPKSVTGEEDFRKSSDTGSLVFDTSTSGPEAVAPLPYRGGFGGSQLGGTGIGKQRRPTDMPQIRDIQRGQSIREQSAGSKQRHISSKGEQRKKLNTKDESRDKFS